MSSSAPDWIAPHFAEPFAATRHRQGGDAQFRAVVRAHPAPSVSWSLRGGALPHSEKHYQYFDPHTGELSLTIRDLGPGDEGAYTCRVENPYGEVSATLKVRNRSYSVLLLGPYLVHSHTRTSHFLCIGEPGEAASRPVSALRQGQAAKMLTSFRQL